LIRRMPHKETHQTVRAVGIFCEFYEDAIL
jgi:hypothetical protein